MKKIILPLVIAATLTACSDASELAAFMDAPPTEFKDASPIVKMAGITVLIVLLGAYAVMLGGIPG